MGIVVKCRESLYGLSAKGMKLDYSQIDLIGGLDEKETGIIKIAD